MSSVDDELLSAYLDGELEHRERAAVEALLQNEAAWRRRFEAFRADSEALRQLAQPSLPSQVRDVVYRAVTESFAMGAERRRVPRFKRRWMMLAAFTVPCLLTLFYLQNPNRDSRLYLRGDQLILRAGRSGQKSRMEKDMVWTSPPLWGALQEHGVSSLSFQVDAGTGTGESLQARVLYDFDGDGQVDRLEEYEAVSLDHSQGWERFTPRLLRAKGEFREFLGGNVVVQLASRDGKPTSLELSGTPGELVLPYRHLKGAEP